MRASFIGILAGWAVAATLLAGGAGAAPPGGDAAPSTGAKAEALAHFIRAEDHFAKHEWHAALDEYNESLRRMRTNGAMASAAACLRQLERYDEALELYEELRHNPVQALSPRLETRVTIAMAELGGLVRTVEVTGDPPAGATLFVDGLSRGKLPLEKPLRLGVGTHVFSVKLEGFDEIKRTVVVKSGRPNVAELGAATKKGRLEVREQHGWALAVEVDGKPVEVDGKPARTPWSGLLDAGPHEVRLEGRVSSEALTACAAPGTTAMTDDPGAGKTEVASKAITVAVDPWRTKPVTLGAEVLDGMLHLEVKPPGAHLAIDAKAIASSGGTWEGPVRLGDHTVGAAAEGFLPVIRPVTLRRGKVEVVVLDLQVDPAAMNRRKARMAGPAYGVGAAGIIVGAVTGGVVLAKDSALKARCGGTTCPKAEQGTIDTIHTLGNVSVGGFVIGALGVAAGTVLVLAQPGKSGSPPGGKAGSLAGWSVGVGPLGLQCEGRF